ncbi:MAG: HAD family hydrolase [Bryobacteraceae bacterium]|nr:HAD family hydrolase [Bryobacteraceae bacterium]
MVDRVLVFDMDGVLLDVTRSYRATIVETVAHFTGKRIDNDVVQGYKNRGGYNDDWVLTRQACEDLGVPLALEEVTKVFNEYFLGVNGRPGLIEQERWIARPGLLETLAQRYQFAIFTGRYDFEIAPTLNRFGAGLRFEPIVRQGMGFEPKPAPDGLLHIASVYPGAELTFIGDTVDDAASAKAAGVRFIAVVAPGVPRYDEVRALHVEHGAAAVIDDINQLESVL